jgi:hypothetical protein
VDQALFNVGSDAFVDDNLHAVVSAGDQSFTLGYRAIFAVFVECPARRAGTDRTRAKVTAATVVAIEAACVDIREKNQNEDFKCIFSVSLECRRKLLRWRQRWLQSLLLWFDLFLPAMLDTQRRRQKLLDNRG